MIKHCIVYSRLTGACQKFCILQLSLSLIHIIPVGIDTTPPETGNYVYSPYKNLLHLHLQLIGVNSEELSLTSVIQCILSSVELKFLFFGEPSLSAFLEY